MTSLFLFLSVFTAYLTGLRADQAHYELLSGADSPVLKLLDRCDFNGDRGFLDDDEHLSVDFTVKVTHATPEVEGDVMELAQDLLGAVDGDATEPFFWADFAAERGEYVFEVVTSDTFKLLNLDMNGTLTNLTFTDHVIDRGNLCTRSTVEIESDDFPVRGMSLKHGTTTVVVHENGEFAIYSTHHNCHVVDADPSDEEVAAMAHKICFVEEPKRQVMVTEVSGICVVDLIIDGEEGFRACREAARQDADGSVLQDRTEL